MLEVKCFGHLSIVVPDIEEAQNYYKTLFGIEPVISFKKLQKWRLLQKYGAARSRSSYSNAAILAYCNLVLEKNGIWIDNKQSRFVVDFNRDLSDAIYSKKSEDWLDIVWKESLTKKEKDGISSKLSRILFYSG